MGARKLLLSQSLALVCQSAAFAGAHKVTYVERTAPLGTQVTLGGATFDPIRVPVSPLSGEQYSLIVPAFRYDPDFGSVNIQALRATSSFVANATVDTYPAYVAVTDRRYYSLSGNVGGGAGVARTADLAAGTEAIIIGGTTFNVGTGVDMTVTIKIGTTLVRYAVELNRELLQTNGDVGSAYNIVPFAEWGKYRDPSISSRR